MIELFQRFRVLGHVVLAMFWWGVIPLLFLTFYATAQLQTAARESVSGAPISNIMVTKRSAELAEIEGKLRENGKLIADHLTDLAKADGAYTNVKHQLRIQLMAINGSDPDSQDLLNCASRDATIGCFERIMVSAHRRVGATPDTAQGSLLREQMAQADKAFIEFVDLSSRTQDIRGRIAALNAQTEAIEKKRAALDGENEAPLTAIARVYDEFSARLPPLKLVFVLPDGAVVGLFTAVMAAIGAVVFSVYGRMLPEGRSGSLANESIFQSYVTRPLLGGLAGFIVYFAMSAGSSLMLDGSAARVDAGSSLSTATLATLGLFAGLASENALLWLTGKARDLFKT